MVCILDQNTIVDPIPCRFFNDAESFKVADDLQCSSIFSKRVHSLKSFSSLRAEPSPAPARSQWKTIHMAGLCQYDVLYGSQRHKLHHSLQYSSLFEVNCFFAESLKAWDLFSTYVLTAHKFLDFKTDHGINIYISKVSFTLEEYLKRK